MAIGRNLIAGLANSAWSALVALAALPFYIKYLGIEAYGLIGFYLTAQVLMQLLDMGMAPTVNREVARCSAEGKIAEAGRLLHSLAVVYVGLAVLIALLACLLAPAISQHWLQSKEIAQPSVSNAVMLMGLVLACRWPIGLYQGALIGAQRLTVSSAINMTMVTLGSAGAILVLAYVSPTVEAFFVWQALIGLLYVITMRFAAWRVIGKEQAGRFDAAYVRRILGFSLGVGAISFAGLLLTQLDKLILSKTVGLDSFGKYMLANTVASSLYILIVPTFNTCFPRFSALVAQRDPDQLLHQYRLASQWLAALLFPTAMILVVLAQPLIALWTGNVALATDAAPLASLLLVAYALHGVMHMPYALMLAFGETRPMFVIYVVLIVVTVPLTTALSLLYGASGGAVAQLCLFMLYLGAGIWVTHQRHFPGYARHWVSKDVGRPAVIATLTGVAGYWAAPWLKDIGLWALLLGGAVLWLIATTVSVFSTHGSRLALIGYWQQFRCK